MQQWLRSKFVLVATLAVPMAAHANNFKARCDADMLNTPQAASRNAWARKCGVISPAAEAFYNSQGQYVTFTNLVAPVDAGAPCAPGAVYLGACNVAGCYTPEQQVVFGQRYVQIVAATQQDTPTVSAFSDNKLDFEGALWPDVEENIGSFVVGEEHKDVLTIAVLDGNLAVEVTDNHPLVDGNGNIIPARKVVAGQTRLMTVTGPQLVTSVTKRRYDGLVYNIEPASTRTYANVLVAQGFVTGSVRYQNEWAEDKTRLDLRNALDTSAF